MNAKDQTDRFKDRLSFRKNIDAVSHAAHFPFVSGSLLQEFLKEHRRAIRSENARGASILEFTDLIIEDLDEASGRVNAELAKLKAIISKKKKTVT